MGLVASTDRRPVFYFIGDSITEQASDPSKSGFITLLQDHYVRSVDMINRGLSGYTTKWRHGDRTNAAAGKYAHACVELAAEENVHVLDLHTYFNTTFPDVNERQTYFVDGLHFSAKGHKEVGKLLSVAINGMFDKEELKRFDKWQLPYWHDFIH
ncbi:hypothetical protein JG688_00013920 [Phytophthora aleatoria]|uniref:SGNH hydrolase-type esterase domain-containing protein n=1 Tax=Phytophthora aleatoria TaxID=2496075 RepID=A0A8J5ICQ5_9STRA|nr:hypothetical protein JG688_00013920 [Phytophthora aleatoria]